MILTSVLLFALQLTPELSRHINAGLKAKAAGDLDAAAREFQRVTELAPKLPAAHVNLGAVHLARKDYDTAVVSLRKALDLNPELPGAHGMLGTALLARGFARDAIPHLEKAEAIDLLGVALLEAGRPREALDRLEAAIEKRPGDPDLLYYIGHAHNQLAARSFDKLRQTGPQSPRTHQVIGESLAASGNADAARARFQSALIARSDLRGVHLALGELFLTAGDYEKAEAEFRAETELAPGSAIAAYKLGVALANRGETAKAVVELTRANKLQPEMPETLFELGKAFNASGDAASAEKYLRQVLAIEKDTTLARSAHFQLAESYRLLKRPADAEREMKAFEKLRNDLRN